MVLAARHRLPAIYESREHAVAGSLMSYGTAYAHTYRQVGVSVTRDMSGFRSTRSVRFVPEGSHAAGGQNGPDHRCDWVASSEEVELRGGSGAVGDERAALSPAARCL